MNSHVPEKSEEHGQSLMAIITSLHKPAQLYARLNMHSYQTGLTIFILTSGLSIVSGFFTFFVFNRPFDVLPDLLSKLASFMIPEIPSILGKITFFLVNSIILALIFRYGIHEQVKFSVPFTIVSTSYVPYYLFRLCTSWLFLMMLFDPLNIIPTGYIYLTEIIPRFVSPIGAALIFFWYMTRGILATTKIRVRYAIPITVVTFVIAWIVSVIEIPVYIFLMNG